MTLSDEERERYQRSILELSAEKQALLKEKTVLQVGAGGLGGPLALYLVAAGVGELILFENDTIDLSNLGRQILYRTSQINQSKGQLAKTTLEELNPNVKITLVEEWLTMDNADKYIQNVDYLVDASDNFDTKFLINDLSLKYNIPATIAGIQGFDGQIISIIPHKSTCYRCIFGKPPKPEKKKSPIPVVSPTCGVVGSLEANEVIKGLLNYGDRILNGLLMVSLRESEFTRVDVKINSKCMCQKEIS